jgi:hypothetical protein
VLNEGVPQRSPQEGTGVCFDSCKAGPYEGEDDRQQARDPCDACAKSEPASTPRREGFCEPMLGVDPSKHLRVSFERATPVSCTNLGLWVRGAGFASLWWCVIMESYRRRCGLCSTIMQEPTLITSAERKRRQCLLRHSQCFEQMPD